MSARAKVKVSNVRVQGNIVEWKGHFGWVQPSMAINHPDSGRHGGRVYLAKSDWQGSVSMLRKGMKVDFVAYADASGIGAQECRPLGPMGPQVNNAPKPAMPTLQGRQSVQVPVNANNRKVATAKAVPVQRAFPQTQQAQPVRKPQQPHHPPPGFRQGKGVPGKGPLPPKAAPALGRVQSAPSAPKRVVAPTGKGLPLGRPMTATAGKVKPVIKTIIKKPPQAATAGKGTVGRPGKAMQETPASKEVKSVPAWKGPKLWRGAVRLGSKSASQLSKTSKGSSRGSAEQGERTMVLDKLITGHIQNWKGRFGWIEPDEAVDHTEASKHQGAIYVHVNDVEGKERLKKGQRVQFLVYADGNGLGAQDCQVVTEVKATKGVSGKGAVGKGTSGQGATGKGVTGKSIMGKGVDAKGATGKSTTSSVKAASGNTIGSSAVKITSSSSSGKSMQASSIAKSKEKVATTISSKLAVKGSKAGGKGKEKEIIPVQKTIVKKKGGAKGSSTGGAQDHRRSITTRLGGALVR